MLLAVLHHQVALKKFTADVDNDLREFELSREEWKAVRDLCDVLKVTINLCHHASWFLTATSTTLGTERCYSLFLAFRNTQSGNGDSSNGHDRQGSGNGGSQRHGVFSTNSV